MGPVTPDAEHLFVSESPERTRELGEVLGGLLEPGDFVGLIGDLGAGKTHLVRGLATGAGVDPSEVSSPTFAIVQPYRGRLLLHHADLYRLGHEDELYATGYFDLLGPQGAMVVEWLDRIPRAAPDERLEVWLSAPDEDRRELRARAYGPRAAALLAKWKERA